MKEIHSLQVPTQPLKMRKPQTLEDEAYPSLLADLALHVPTSMECFGDYLGSPLKRKELDPNLLRLLPSTSVPPEI